MPRSREDYPIYIENLGFSAPPSEPLAILARSGGHKVTDSFSLFPKPEEVSSPAGERRYTVCFFIHGMRYMQPSARERGGRALDAIARCIRIWTSLTSHLTDAPMAAHGPQALVRTERP